MRSRCLPLCQIGEANTAIPCMVLGLAFENGEKNKTETLLESKRNCLAVRSIKETHEVVCRNEDREVTDSISV